MSPTAVQPSFAAAGLAPGAPVAAPARSGDVPFGDVVTNMLGEANSQQHNIGLEVQKLISGESDSVHDVVLSIAQADLAFRMVMQIRDQLISSYQEIMRMQV
jgi:flagellar hook-basal body complex protein FliE